MSEQDKAFEDYWKNNGVTFSGPAVMELTFKEIAQKAFAAGRKLENEECARIADDIEELIKSKWIARDIANEIRQRQANG